MRLHIENCSNKLELLCTANEALEQELSNNQSEYQKLKDQKDTEMKLLSEQVD